MIRNGSPPLWTLMRRLIWLKKLAGGAAVSWNTVSGTSPLTLSDALAKPIKSLIQYGKCTQAATPTPSVPVDIVCNNGALKMVDDELPSGYKRITGIKFDGDFYYNTGESLSGDDDVTMTLANTSTTGQNVFGSYNGTASDTKNFSLFIYGGGSQSNSYFRYGGQLLRPRFGTGERTITFGKSGTDGFATDATAVPDEFTTPANAYIGMLPNSTSPAFTGSIIGNILIGTRLKYIPVERESDGAIGYFERAKGNFIAPTGSGTPVSLGYDTSHLNVLSVVGTPEVLTIGEQTATVQNLFGVGDYADTQDIISGAVTRNIGIIVLDGTEAWTGSRTNKFYSLLKSEIEPAPIPVGASALCTHFVSDSSEYASVQGSFYLGTSYLNLNYDNQGGISTSDNCRLFKEFLAAQYAAGTPVIILYPLAEPTTEHVTPQPLSTAEGTNTVSWTAEVSGTTKTIEYAQAAAPSGDNLFIPKNSTGLMTSDGKTFKVKEE